MLHKVQEYSTKGVTVSALWAWGPTQHVCVSTMSLPIYVRIPQGTQRKCTILVGSFIYWDASLVPAFPGYVERPRILALPLLHSYSFTFQAHQPIQVASSQWWLTRIHWQDTGPLFYFTLPCPTSHLLVYESPGVCGVTILKGKLTQFYRNVKVVS